MKSVYTRIIKFKAWHRKEKKLYDVMQLRMHPSGNFLVRLHGRPNTWFSDTDVELLQYTNLPDMHDQEIYEGFVLRDPKTDCYYEVLYPTNCATRLELSYVLSEGTPPAQSETRLSNELEEEQQMEKDEQQMRGAEAKLK